MSSENHQICAPLILQVYTWTWLNDDVMQDYSFDSDKKKKQSSLSYILNGS